MRTLPSLLARTSGLAKKAGVFGGLRRSSAAALGASFRRIADSSDALGEIDLRAMEANVSGARRMFRTTFPNVVTVGARDRKLNRLALASN